MSEECTALLEQVPVAIAVYTADDARPQLTNLRWREQRELATLSDTARARIQAVIETGHPEVTDELAIQPLRRDATVVGAIVVQTRTARDPILAIVSHELRAPITTLLLWLRVLRDCLDDPVARAQALDAIHQSALQQSRLITDLLDISRALSGKLHVNVQPTELVPLLEHVLLGSRHAASERQIVVVADVAPDLGVASCDAVRVQQILDNLVANALKHTPAGGQISVHAKREPSEIVISVTDTGRGIAREDLPHVFEPFHQGRRSELDGGLGLGLAIAHELATMHGGSLVAESEGPGLGASFTLRLPLIDLPLRERTSDDGATTSLAQVRVAIVESDARVLGALQRVLERLGAHTTVADSAATAWVAIHAPPAPDVVLIDLALAGCDGYRLVHRIRGAGGDLARVPTIAISADAADRLVAYEAGFDLHITKPFDVDALVSAIASLVVGRRR